MNTTTIDALITAIGAMDRRALIDALLSMESRFPMDFSASWLDQWPDEKLRHVLLAATTQANGDEPA